MNVLIAPKIDGTLENLTLWFASGSNPQAACKHGEELKPGDTVSDYGIWNMERGFLKDTFAALRGNIYDIDLSLKAPVQGLYYGANSFFSSNSDQEYSLEKAVQDTQPPTTLEQINDPHKFPRAFNVITPEFVHLNGAELYHNFFDTLRENRTEISSWPRLKSDTLQSSDAFLRSVYTEEDRLSKITCPVLPYDESTFG